jgi:hypothetical protein
MRRSDRNAGSIKALIILVLIAANIVVALAHHRPAQSSQTIGMDNPRYSGRLHDAARFDEPSQP